MDNPSGAVEGAAARRLESIQALIGETFAHTDVDTFLDTLLQRVRDILDVDTATILLLDRSGRELVAAAAQGIEEEVSQAAHVPVGLGFAGRVAGERRPIYVANVPTADVFNPLLAQKGLHSLLGVPLVRAGTLLGVLHVGTIAPRRFTAEEEEILQIAGSQAAMAVQTMLTQAERTGAQELQRSLIPSELPDVPGFELAARYRPGKAIVGGDWYDVFPLPSGEIGIVMGDVAGHGLPAAVVMGRMRSALRAYALESDDPAEVLYRLNRKMLHFEPDATATVMYALCDPATGRIRMSSAGHPPPVLAVPDSAARAVDVAFDVLIGLDDVAPRRTTTFDLAPGSLLGFYTDGLIERRDDSIHTGIAKLCGVTFAGPPERVAAAVMAELIGREPATDDVALLLVRRSLA